LKLVRNIAKYIKFNQNDLRIDSYTVGVKTQNVIFRKSVFHS